MTNSRSSLFSHKNRLVMLNKRHGSLDDDWNVPNRYPKKDTGEDTVGEEEANGKNRLIEDFDEIYFDKSSDWSNASTDNKGAELEAKEKKKGGGEEGKEMKGERGEKNVVGGELRRSQDQNQKEMISQQNLSKPPLDPLGQESLVFSNSLSSLALVNENSSWCSSLSLSGHVVDPQALYVQVESQFLFLFFFLF